MLASIQSESWRRGGGIRELRALRRKSVISIISRSNHQALIPKGRPLGQFPKNCPMKPSWHIISHSLSFGAARQAGLPRRTCVFSVCYEPARNRFRRPTHVLPAFFHPAEKRDR